jgi:hypothetical protein
MHAGKSWWCFVFETWGSLRLAFSYVHPDPQGETAASQSGELLPMIGMDRHGIYSSGSGVAELPTIIQAAPGSPQVFVGLSSTEEIKLSRPFLNRLFDGMPNHQGAGTERGNLRFKSAQLIDGTAAV